VAITLSLPEGSLAVVKIAIPLAIVAVPTTVAPLINVTMPVALWSCAMFGARLAVSTTGWNWLAVAGFALRVSAVGTCSAVSGIAAETLGR
jgi:hypothetical protein